MKFWKSLTTATAIMASSNVNAALIERLGGLAYYDDVANLTWLADANYAMTSGYDSDGLMTWAQASTWAANLNVSGVDGWRLAETLQPDASCDSQSNGLSWGNNCTGSEMGNLYYNALENTAGTLTNSGPFSNINSGNYWSATEYVTNTDFAWTFWMTSGSQNNWGYKTTNYSAWAVHSGDVNAVPVPAAIWLFGSGLIGLIGVARRKNN